MSWGQPPLIIFLLKVGHIFLCFCMSNNVELWMIYCRDSESHYLPLNSVFIKPTFNLAGFCFANSVFPIVGSSWNLRSVLLAFTWCQCMHCLWVSQRFEQFIHRIWSTPSLFLFFPGFLSFLSSSYACHKSSSLFLQPSKAMSFLLEF